MKILRLIWFTCADHHYTRAMSNLHPTHEDIPYIVLRHRVVKDALAAAWR